MQEGGQFNFLQALDRAISVLERRTGMTTSALNFAQGFTGSSMQHRDSEGGTTYLYSPHQPGNRPKSWDFHHVFTLQHS